eukprot:176429-Chlamydomonas_euryale.AAC.1
MDGFVVAKQWTRVRWMPGGRMQGVLKRVDGCKVFKSVECGCSRCETELVAWQMHAICSGLAVYVWE